MIYSKEVKDVKAASFMAFMQKSRLFFFIFFDKVMVNFWVVFIFCKRSYFILFYAD